MEWQLTKLESQEDCPAEPLLPENGYVEPSSSPPGPRISAYIALQAVIGILLFGIGYWVHATLYWNALSTCQFRRPSDTEWLFETPADINWSPIRLNGTLYSLNKFRGPPSAQIDSEWNRFTTNPWMVETAAVLRTTIDQIQRSSNDGSVDTLVHLDQENGGGYMGSLEMFHQLHCLNILRKWTYLEYYEHNDSFFMHSSHHRREHTDHCIDIIRQVLMCNGDMGLVMFHWVQGMDVPTPDFNTMHSCRDPEAILQWAISRKAPISHSIERVPGQKNLSHAT